MASFVLLLAGDVSGASAGELGARTARQATWLDGLRKDGVVVDGGRIDGGAIRVRKAPGDAAVLDVPADLLGSVRAWLLVHADDVDSAVALARSCPEADFAEVRVLRVDE